MLPKIRYQIAVYDYLSGLVHLQHMQATIIQMNGKSILKSPSPNALRQFKIALFYI